MRPSILSKLSDRKVLQAAYTRVFESPDGKLILRHLMNVGFVTKSTFVRGDANESALNEGTRRLVLSILKMVYRDDTDLQQAVEDAAREEQS